MSINLLYPTIKLAYAAGEIILKHYKNPTFTLKADQSPLSIADMQSHHFLSAKLNAQSHIPVCSEEAPLSYAERKDLPYLWLLDPLDGTKDFLAQNDGFTINIALLKNNLPILGIVYAPALKELYYAYQGKGAYFLSTTNFDPTQAIKITPQSPITSPSNPIACVSNFHDTPQTQDFLQHYNLTPLPLGSALKLCALATHKAHIYPRFNGTKEWDTAASDIIITEAGGVILDCKTKQPLLYNKPDLRNNHFIAFSKSLIDGKIYRDFLANML
ncbi:hypothetical protein BKH46_06945 [Helicobacter sp. 12S02634-8]|uniref:3'(2'),5'-bisphosphate nucleotidase CysQ family protein n=1 Tax=Helicobacter sp. 12S02634-8 TaxID=1476199 RepID=UPI000BA60928|nr:3'(2'),5'-bisphosphate nucleotidase CysQ [Helicobacter sp. 12S02634-8]PAF46696.1 hypothetical protein BKH46_06945 [Helicobacter sp. 12S02634-8]